MNANWIILLIGLSGGAIPAYLVTSTYYQKVIAQEHEEQQKAVIEQQELNRREFLEYANRIVKSEADHDKNIHTIRNLNRELNGLRIAFPTCPVSDTTEAGADSDGRARILSDELDAAFADLQKEAGRLVERCDELNVDATRANEQMPR